MIWPSDIVQVLSLLVVSAGIAGACIAIAWRLRLDRFLVCRPQAERAERAVDTLAALADLAHRQGILSIEVACGSSGLPGLRRGVELLAAGRPVHEVRSALLDDLDEQVLKPRLPWRGVVLMATAVACLGAALAAAVMLQRSGALVVPLALLASAVVPATLLLPWATRLLDGSVRSTNALIFEGMLVIEAVCLIGGGRDGETVRSALGRSLPGPQPARAAAA